MIITRSIDLFLKGMKTKKIVNQYGGRSKEMMIMEQMPTSMMEMMDGRRARRRPNNKGARKRRSKKTRA